VGGCASGWLTHHTRSLLTHTRSLLTHTRSLLTHPRSLLTHTRSLLTHTRTLLTHRVGTIRIVGELTTIVCEPHSHYWVTSYRGGPPSGVVVDC